jgi:hypothetical protein
MSKLVWGVFDQLGVEVGDGWGAVMRQMEPDNSSNS